MNNRIEKWHTEIDKNTSMFEEEFNSISVAELNWKPNKDSWSVGQVIEHLLKTTTNYFSVTDKINEKNFRPSFLSKISFFPKIFGNMILKGVDPKTKRKVKTMNIFAPETSTVEDDILNQFIDSQKQLHSWINENEERIISRMVIPSPLNRHLVYHFDTVIDIIVNHQKRHFQQACNVLKTKKQNG